MGKIALNIVLLPDKKTKELSRSISQQLSTSLQSRFVLDDSQYLPHLSLYQAQYVESNKDKVFAAVKDIASRTDPFMVTFSGYSLFAEFIYLDAYKSKKLQSLHQQILKACDPYRQGLIPDPVRELLDAGKFNSEQAQATRKYGHPFTGQLFSPHLTLTRLETIESKTSVVLASLPQEKVTMLAKEIGIVSVNEHGTCNQIYEVFSLK